MNFQIEGGCGKLSLACLRTLNLKRARLEYHKFIFYEFKLNVLK